jgi:hypothetical protein
VVQHGLEVVSGRIGQQRVADHRLLQLVLAEGRRARSQSLEKKQIQFFKSSGPYVIEHFLAVKGYGRKVLMFVCNFFSQC